MNGMIKEVKAESSERAAKLSHYIDEEVRKLAEVVIEKYSKMKSVFIKLSEHFCNHLISTESNRKNI
jgi:tRNA isopentenyl-2-thiomethyl-A-37 hydroxylase MiaE